MYHRWDYLRKPDFRKEASWCQEEAAADGWMGDRRASGPVLSLLVINEERIEDASSSLQSPTKGENAARQSFLVDAFVWHGGKRQDWSLKTNHFTQAPWYVPPSRCRQITAEVFGVCALGPSGPQSAYKNMGRMSHGSVKVISQTPDWCGRCGGAESAVQAVVQAGVGGCKTARAEFVPRHAL